MKFLFAPNTCPFMAGVWLEKNSCNSCLSETSYMRNNSNEVMRVCSCWISVVRHHTLFYKFLGRVFCEAWLAYCWLAAVRLDQVFLSGVHREASRARAVCLRSLYPMWMAFLGTVFAKTKVHRLQEIQWTSLHLERGWNALCWNAGAPFFLAVIKSFGWSWRLSLFFELFLVRMA